MPTFARLASDRGFVTIYYDNFLILSNDETDIHMFEKRLAEAASKTGVVIKEGSLHKCLDLEKEECDFLGITFKVEGSVLQWWPTKIAEWKKGFEDDPGLEELRTPRDFAASVGRGIYATLASGKRLGHTTEGRKLSRLAALVGKAGHRLGCAELSTTK
mgnify:FL=1